MVSRTVWTKAALALGLAAGVAWPAVARAQARDLDREASAGKVFPGRFGEGDAPAVFVLTLAADSAVEVEALPAAGVDPRIAVFEEGASEPFVQNDDAAGSLAAMVRLYSATRKRVRIEVSGTAGDSGDSTGPQFNLVLLPSDYRPNPEKDIALGQTVEGALRQDDEQLFHFQGDAGQVWELAFAKRDDSSGLDPFLAVFTGRSAVGEPLKTDDDGAGNLNSLLRFTVPETGSYTVRLSALNGGAGDYTFSAGDAGRAPPPGDGTLSLGPAVTGEIGGKAEARVYQLSDEAKSQLSTGAGTLLVRMNAPDGSSFDPLLDVGFETPLGFTSAQSDDDGGGGLNACLLVPLARFAEDPGWLDRLRIKAGSALGGEGSFTISLTPLPPGDQTPCLPPA